MKPKLDIDYLIDAIDEKNREIEELQRSLNNHIMRLVHAEARIKELEEKIKNDQMFASNNS